MSEPGFVVASAEHLGRRGRRWDPRHLAALGTVLALAAVVGLASVILVASNRSRGFADHGSRAVDPPLVRLQETLDASDEGQAQLVLAAATTGAERTRHLEASIAAGESAARSWVRYQALALPMDGVAPLEDRYERDYAAGKVIAADSIVPILRVDRPVAIAPQQVEAAMRNDADLRALRSRYQVEQAATYRRLAAHVDATGRRIRVGAVAGILLVTALGLGAVRSAGRSVRAQRTRADAAELAAFESQLVRGLELLDDDDQALEMASRALGVAVPTATIAVSITDHGGTALRSTAGSLACGIDSTDRCPAVRAGVPLQFADNEALDACAHLVGAAPCSSTCLPISIAGRSAGVVQLLGAVGGAPEAGGAVRSVVRRVGERITMMRSIARFELQASRDPLTGLINRRSLEQAVSDLHESGTSYAVAFADLDHFKRLNDDFGHQAGDMALCTFATILASSLRGVDLACRWGGEEFVAVLPGCDQGEAMEAMERVRALLVLDGLRETGPPMTVSIGIALFHAGETFAETVARADTALNDAKTTGRNRIVGWSPMRNNDQFRLGSSR